MRTPGTVLCVCKKGRLAVETALQIVGAPCEHCGSNLMHLVAGNDLDPNDLDRAMGTVVSPLREAVRKAVKQTDYRDYSGIVKALFEMQDGKTLVLQADSKFRTPIYVAVQEDNRRVIEFFESNGIDITGVDAFGSLILHVAAKYDSFSVANLLAMRPGLLKQRDDDGNTALHIAVQHDSVNAVAEFIKAAGSTRAAFVQSRNNEGQTPLHIAAMRNCVNSAKLLKETGAATGPVDRNGNTPMHVAAILNNTGIVRKLIEWKADIEIKNKNGYTPLTIAASHDSRNVVRLLITHNAKIKDENGNTVMHIVIRSTTHPDIVSFLADNIESIVTMPDNEGNTPMHIAAKFGKANVIALLVRAGATLDCVNRNGDSPIHLASRYNKLAAVAELVSRKAIVTVTNKDDNTPLHLAQMARDTPQISHAFSFDVRFDTVTDYLLRPKGAKAAAYRLNKEGDAPIHIAARNGKWKSIAPLQKNEKNINITNKSGLTALILATVHSQVLTIRALIKNGADINRTDRDGNTALDYAINAERMDLVALFINIRHSIDSKTLAAALKIAKKKEMAAAALLIETRPVSVPHRTESSESCGICCEIFESGELLSISVTCGHMFHEECAGTWKEYNNTCSLCRAKLSLEYVWWSGLETDQIP